MHLGHSRRPGTRTINVFIIVPAAFTACTLHEVIDTRFRGSGLPTSSASSGNGDEKGEQDGASWHLSERWRSRTTRINVRIRYEEAGPPEDRALWRWLVIYTFISFRQYLKKNAVRIVKSSRVAHLFLRDLVSRMNGRGQRFHIFFYITPFSATSTNGYHSIFMRSATRAYIFKYGKG